MATPCYTSWDVSSGLQLAAQIPHTDISWAGFLLLGMKSQGVLVSFSPPTCLVFFFFTVLMGRRALFLPVWQGSVDTGRGFSAAFAKSQYGYSRGDNHFLGPDTGRAAAALNGAITSPQSMHCALEHVGLNPWIELSPWAQPVSSPPLQRCLGTCFCVGRSVPCDRNLLCLHSPWTVSDEQVTCILGLLPWSPGKARSRGAHKIPIIINSLHFLRCCL